MMATTFSSTTTKPSFDRFRQHTEQGAACAMPLTRYPAMGRGVLTLSTSDRDGRPA